MKKALLFLIFCGNVSFPSQSLGAGAAPRLLGQVIEGLQKNDQFLARFLKVLGFETELEDINNIRLAEALRDLTPKRAHQFEKLLFRNKQEIFPILKKTPMGAKKDLYLLEEIQEQAIKDWRQDGAPAHRAGWFLRWWIVTQKRNINDLRLFEEQWFEEKGQIITTDALFKNLPGDENTPNIYYNDLDKEYDIPRPPRKPEAIDWTLDEIHTLALAAYVEEGEPHASNKWFVEWLSREEDRPSFTAYKRSWEKKKGKRFRIDALFGKRPKIWDLDEIQALALKAWIEEGKPNPPRKWFITWLSREKERPPLTTYRRHWQRKKGKKFRIEDLFDDEMIAQIQAEDVMGYQAP